MKEIKSLSFGDSGLMAFYGWWGGWGLGWLKFSDPKKALPKRRLNQGADVLCFVELDCYHECGIRQVIFLVQCWPSWEKNTQV